MVELFLLIVLGLLLALGRFIAKLVKAGPLRRRKLLVVGGLVTAGVCCWLAAFALFIVALAAATDDVGSTWSNTGAHTLVAPMVICVVVGTASFAAALVAQRRN